MKKWFLLGFLLSASLHAQDEKDLFIAHEWGSMNVIQGSDQAIIGGLVDDQSDLPEFVQVWEDNPRLPLPGIIEKPIIYFYTKKAMRARVEVGSPTGLITQWWPEASYFSPAAPLEGVEPELKNGRLAWNELYIQPEWNDARLRNTEDHVWWPIARETDSAFIFNHQGATEKFLFYRGLAKFTPTLKASYEGGNWSFSSGGDESFSDVLAIHVSVDGKSTIRHYKTLQPSKEENQSELFESVGEAAMTLQSSLKTAGLYEKEAQGMVEIWKDSLFKTAGTRFLYFMKDETLETLLPLTINPTPDELARVMLIRVELLNQEREDAIMGWIKQLSDSDFSVRQAANDALLKQGRAGQALMRQALQEAEDLEVTVRLRNILKKISPLRPGTDSTEIK